MSVDYVELLRDMNSKIKDLNGLQSEVIAGFGGMKAGAIKDGALSAKTKELIALSLGVDTQCDPCIAFHAQACFKYGATREEVAEALGVCVMMGGGPKLMYASKALAAYDQFVAAAA